MKPSLLKPLLLAALSASMLVGCTELPTSKQNPDSSQETAQAAITTQAVKDLLREVKQSLTSLRSVNGASKDLNAPASGYRLSGYAIAQAEDPWEWTTEQSEEGTQKLTRHVVEKNAAGETVVDITSTYLMTGDGSSASSSRTDIVAKSPTMSPGTYTMEGTYLTSGEYGKPGYTTESTLKSSFAPEGGGAARVTTATISTSAAGMTFQAAGTLPDGSTIALDGSMTQSGDLASMTTDGKMTLILTSPSGKAITVESDFDGTYSQSGDTSTSESKGFYQVSLGTLLKVRFNIDTLSNTTRVDDGSGDFSNETTYPRNNITAELLDGAGKSIAPIELEATTDHSKPPTKGTITLGGEAPTELDMSFMTDIMAAQTSLMSLGGY